MNIEPCSFWGCSARLSCIFYDAAVFFPEKKYNAAIEFCWNTVEWKLRTANFPAPVKMIRGNNKMMMITTAI